MRRSKNTEHVATPMTVGGKHNIVCIPIKHNNTLQTMMEEFGQATGMSHRKETGLI